MDQYWQWLIVVSLGIALAERLRPARPRQPVRREQLLTDIGWLAFNGHFYGIWFRAWIGWIALSSRDVVATVGLVPDVGWLDGRAFWLQFVVYLVVSDFLQWCVHRLLHAVPWLWQFHKLHHSVHEMDWIANFRFHWVETIVYRSLLFVPVVLWLGGDYPPLLTAWVAGTAWGHFNHANVDVDLGPLRYIFNSPRMHLWHHDATGEGRTAKNFGIVLSAWDWIFGTVHWPEDRPPARIGYPGDEEMPRHLPEQMLWPLWRRRA